MDNLPSEIILYVTTFLEPLEIVNLQRVSRRFFRIARDNSLWRTQCFEQSTWEKLRRRREFLASSPIQQPLLRDLQRALGSREPSQPQNLPIINIKAMIKERTRILANWDPSYPDEKVDWAAEFIHRCAPIAVSWLQQPRNGENIGQVPMEIRGAGIYNPPGDDATSMVVGPLDDGSICIWDVSGPPGQRGRMISRSATHTISTSGSPSDISRSRMINTGVTECISIDSHSKRAYIAVQCELVEVDLETLQVVSQEKFPFSISAISEAKHPTPITVGTNLSLHMYDSRASLSRSTSSDAPECVEEMLSLEGASTFQSINNTQLINYAPLLHPGPLSIIHIPTLRNFRNGGDEIYVAGRFSSILNYDRRYFPKLRGTIFSGARLCSLTSIPYPFTAHLRDRMRRGELSIEQVDALKADTGNTLIACGEYNSKGSLELYGLPSTPRLTTLNEDILASKAQNSNFLKNRQTSSDSKILSVSTHGTRIVFSDGGGNVKWVERDGFTGVRDWNIGCGFVEGPRSIFGTLGDSYMGSSTSDIVRKVLHTKSDIKQDQIPVEKDDLILWTGEKLALLSFSSKPGFTADSFEEKAKSIDDTMKEMEERVYGQDMRRALQIQADEVRFVTGLGLSYR